MSGKLLPAAALLEGTYAVLLVLLFLRALLRAAACRRNQAAAAALRPQIRETLLTYLIGGDNAGQFRQWAKSHRRLLIECVWELRTTVSGGARERLWDLSLELDLVQEWTSEGRSRDPRIRCAALDRLALASAHEPCRRVAGELQRMALDDPNPGVRLAAARGLAQSDDPKDLERVFQFAVSSTILARVLLTEVLRPHAVLLSQTVVPKILHSGDEPRILAALEMVNAWGRAVPLFAIHELIEEGSKAVRVQALSALPLVPLLPENRQVLVRAITDSDPEIALAAVCAARSLPIREARQALERHARSGSPALAQAASEALAAIGNEKEILA